MVEAHAAAMTRWSLIEGDVRTVDLGSGFDGVLCDPPYELGYMGRAWDRSGVSFDPQTWARILDACKPGAHMLAFGGTRTMHRITCAIEDGGWQIRDALMWLYGSGFPKSFNVSKAMAGEDGRLDGGCVAVAERAAWDGYGTALKPAYEPIALARAPLVGGVVENVLKFGCGALAIDACRVGGRWPANVLLDEDADALLDAASSARGVSGGASRFFYTAKASREDRTHGLRHMPAVPPTEMVGRAKGPFSPRPACRMQNPHPTVKPTDLLEYLAKLILPPRRDTPRRLLVPFAGSGSEMIAALRAGWDEVVGIEIEYAAIARERLAHADKSHQTEMFG